MFEQVKQEIDDKIKTNGNNEITAARLNSVLQDMMEAAEEEIENVAESVGDQVEANPTGAATDNLEKIKIGEKVYDIPDPDTSNFVTNQELQQGLSGKQDTIGDLSQIREGAGEGSTALQPVSGAPENNFAAFDENGGIKDSGFSDDSFIKGVKQNGNQITPDANGMVDVTVQDGKSALQIYNETYGTNLDEAQFINVLKQNYPMEYVAYNQTAAGQPIGTGFSAIDTLTADSTTAGKMYLMPNDGATPTGTILFVTVQTGVSTYAWYKLGDLDVPNNVLTKSDVVNDLTTGGIQVPLSAEQGKKVAEKIIREIKNYPIDKESYTEVGFYRPDGSYSSSTSYLNTGFVKIDNIRDFILTVNSRSNQCSPVTFWDEDKVFIPDTSVTPSSTNGVQTFHVTVPSTAKYAIFSHHEAYGWFDYFSIKSYVYINSLIYNDYCYLSINGNDNNDGLDAEHPIQTVARAKELIGDNGTLFIMAGVYENFDFDFSTFAKVIGVGNVIFEKYQKKITNASLVSGYTRVYQDQDQYVIIPENMMFIWQHDIPDARTIITAEERHPLHRNKTHRLPSTRIYRASSIQEIEETTSKQMFYYDANTRTTYFSILDGSNLSSNPVVIPPVSTVVYKAGRKRKVYIENINIKYCGFKTENLYGEIAYVSVGMNHGGGAFIFDKTTDLIVSGCEGYAASAETGGDGFNTHGSASFGIARIYMYDCWGHDNRDDGESCHEYSLIIQRGGLYEYNGSGCVPAAGGNGEYYNVTCRNNKNWDWCYVETRGGFSAQSDNPDIGYSTIKCYNCISEGNYNNYMTSNVSNEIASACYGCISINPVHNHFQTMDNNFGSIIIDDNS